MEHERFKWLWSSWGVFIKGVRSWRLYLVFSFGALLLCAFIFLLVRHYFLVIPSRDLAAAWITPSWERELTQKEAYDLQNSIRQTFVQALGGAIQALGGAALLLGLYFTARTLRISADTLRTNQDTLRTNQKALGVAQEGQITERFTKAIEHLGDKDHLMIRLGGIYALERIAHDSIARDSDKDYWPIMEVLTAFVREQTRVQETTPNTPSSGSEESSVQEREKVPADIQAILTVLGRRERTFGNGESQRLDLREVQLQGADFGLAQLQGTIFQGAQLQKARFRRAQLQGTIFIIAQLQEADFVGAQLQGALFIDSQLQGADFGLAQLEGARFEGAQLQGAFLGTAKNLTQDQINLACVDENTALPEGLIRPAPRPTDP